MVGILLSGNFSFLNHLTIIPALACFDDACAPSWLSSLVRRRAQNDPRVQPPMWRTMSLPSWDVLLLLGILYLSWPVLANLLQWGGSRQLMNASFDSFRLVNTYGAFGSVGEARYEVIVQVHNGSHWIELELPCKPGNVHRRPCLCAPYHYRLDWNIWFLGFKPHHHMLRQRETWVFDLLTKLLQTTATSSQRPWLDLLDPSSADWLQSNFYQHHRAPLAVKVEMYHYQMTKSLWTLALDWWQSRRLVWWKRRYEESLIPPIVWNNVTGRLELARPTLIA